MGDERKTDDMADKRRCIGSTRFGIDPHDAPVEDFPKQPSQKDGLGRMCKTHWNQYTAGLARDAKVRKAAADQPATDVPAVSPSEPAATRKRPAVESTAADDVLTEAGS